MATETLSENIVRIRKELSTARATRDRIEKTGASSSFGGIAFSNVSYDSILKRIGRLELELFNLESANEGSAVRGDVTFVKIDSRF